MTKRKNRAKRKALMLPASPRRRADGKLQSPGPSQRERDARATALAARIRHGVNPRHMDDPLAGYPIGLAVLAGRLSRDDHDRARAFAIADAAARAADGRPAINPPAVVLGAVRGRPARPFPTLADLDAIRHYDRIRDRLVAALGAAGFVAFENIVLSDAPLDEPAALYRLQMGCAALRRAIG